MSSTVYRPFHEKSNETLVQLAFLGFFERIAVLGCKQQICKSACTLFCVGWSASLLFEDMTKCNLTCSET